MGRAYGFLAAFGVVAFATLCGAPALRAQGTSVGPFELTPLTEQALSRLRTTSQELALAQESGAGANAEAAARDLVATAQNLSFKRLPDVAIASAWLAERAARRGDFEAAERALKMAEMLDPGRPETAFARSFVARRQGSWLRAAREQLRGFREVWDARPSGRIARHDLKASLLFALLLSAGGWVAVLAGVHGRRLLDLVAAAWERFLPRRAAIALFLLVTCAPLALRDGLGIVVVVWSVALFVIVRTPERVALSMAIGVFCLAPWGLSEIERRMAIDSSPGMRALDHLAAGRLSSTLFADLGTLDAQLREENAVKAVVADVHRRLGQWESARRLYTELAEAEPNNPSPILGLGAYHFAKNDFKRAVEQFLRAVEVDPRSVEAFFNLSQSYGSAYLFEDSRSALARANAIAPERVGQWVNSPPIERLVVPDPVVVRRAEIEMALTDRRPTATFGRIPLWAWSLISWVLLVAIAIAAATAWSRRPRGAETADGDLGPFERLPPLWTALLPGAVSTAKGRPVLGWLAWVPFSLGIALAAGSRWTPVPSSPMVSSSTLALVVALVGLAMWIGLRWFWALREET